MDTLFEQLFGDTGILIFVVTAWLLLMISTMLLFKQKGIALEGWTGRLGFVGQESRLQKLILVSVIFIVAWASLMFWGELSTGAPYIDDYVWNLLFIGFIVIVMASLIAYAVVSLKYHTTMKGRRGG